MKLVTIATCALLGVGAAQLSVARQSGQTTFASPEEASRALFAAVQKHDEQSLKQILGAGPELLESDDRAQDALERERFAQKYAEMHRLAREPDGAAILYIGAENWPFPIPLEAHNGQWRFDPDAGLNEVRFRRIGENEATAIGICHALVATYTRPGNDGETDGLVRAVLPDIEHNKPVSFHGYYFRILSDAAGEFGAIAYPAIYRSSGVMTFVVSQDDLVYEKDLGPNTAQIAKAMRTYHSDPTWAVAE